MNCSDTIRQSSGRTEKVRLPLSPLASLSSYHPHVSMSIDRPESGALWDPRYCASSKIKKIVVRKYLWVNLSISPGHRNDICLFICLSSLEFQAFVVMSIINEIHKCWYFIQSMFEIRRAWHVARNKCSGFVKADFCYWYKGPVVMVKQR